MKKINIQNITLLASVASIFIQIGAQLFALVVVARTVIKAPPRSFAILQGEHGYNSSAFWNTVPPITFLLLVIALVINWKTRRRKLLLLSLTLFIVGGLLAGLYLEPLFDEMKAMGYRDEVDPLLQIEAARWYTADWALWCMTLVSGFALLLAFLRPGSTTKQAAMHTAPHTLQESSKKK